MIFIIYFFIKYKNTHIGKTHMNIIPSNTSSGSNLPNSYIVLVLYNKVINFNIISIILSHDRC